MYFNGSWTATVARILVPAPITICSFHRSSPTENCGLPFPRGSFIALARKRDTQPNPVVKPISIEEVPVEDEQELQIDDFDDDSLMDKDGFEDEYAAEDAELYAGDGGEGGGISFAGTWWDKEAFTIAENVSLSLDGDLKIYAFKTSANATIQVRIEKMSNKSGSPSLSDIETFSTTYRARLDDAVIAKSVPEDLTLEVSSPGIERVVRIPQDLDRFKDRPMYVRYRGEVADDGSSAEHDGFFRLITFNPETSCCTWGLADVRINREKAGKGRPLSKKQREWRLNTPFDSLLLVRLYFEM